MEPTLHRYERVQSTQDLLHQLAQEGSPPGTAVVAIEQTGGRGSRRSDWVSPPGGLWLSVLVRPVDELAASVLSMRVGLAVAETIERVAGLEPRLKWPNDIMLGDRKVGGILCEARWTSGRLGWVAVGIGLNVENQVPPGLDSVATSLREAGAGITAADLAGPLARTVGELSRQRGPLTPDELDRYRARDWLLGRWIREPTLGRVAGVDADGALLVRSDEGRPTRCRAGHVVLQG